jgi:hypothetical protein
MNSREGYGTAYGYHLPRERAWTWCGDGVGRNSGLLCSLWCKLRKHSECSLSTWAAPWSRWRPSSCKLSPWMPLHMGLASLPVGWTSLAAEKPRTYSLSLFLKICHPCPCYFLCKEHCIHPFSTPIYFLLLQSTLDNYLHWKGYVFGSLFMYPSPSQCTPILTAHIFCSWTLSYLSLSPVDYTYLMAGTQSFLLNT